MPDEKKKSPSTFSIVLEHLGYSPGGRSGYKIVDGEYTLAGEIVVQRSSLRRPEDEAILLDLNKHPVLVERGHYYRVD